MTRTIEIIGQYEGTRMVFDNPSGSVVIGSIRLVNGSKQAAIDAGVVDANQPVGVKGEASRAELVERSTYRFLGHWSDYRNKRTNKNEKQFHFRTFVEHIPHDAEGLSQYLVAAGRGHGIGPAKARRLVEAFGVDGVLEACRNDPAQVARVASISIGDAEAFRTLLNDRKGTENATIETDKLLTGMGFPRSLVKRVITEWGNRAAEMIANDPYQLMGFKGAGFRLCDKLYMELGKDPASIDRQALCLWYAMASDSNGHTWFQASEAVQGLQSMIGGANVDYKAAIVRGREFGAISEDHYGAIASIRSDGFDGGLRESGSTLWLAEGKSATIEKGLAKLIVDAMTENESQLLTIYADREQTEIVPLEVMRCARCHKPLTAATVHVMGGMPYGPTCIQHVDSFNLSTVMTRGEWIGRHPAVKKWMEQHPTTWWEVPAFAIWPDVSAIEGIDDHQRGELAKATMGRVGILGGSPGTGKTWTASALIQSLLASGRVGELDIGIGAPTGKAAVRLTETMNKAGLNLRARTWHSILGVGESSETGGWSFKHNAENPLPYRILIGDESSMLDESLMRSIMAARQPGCHVLWIGDVNQLPPVGSGAPLRDMIAAGLPYGELTEIKRNSGGIVEACAAIRDEKPWLQFTEAAGSNLTITDSETTEDQLEAILRVISEAKNAGLDPILDCQVLCAVNERSPMSRKILNQTLQFELNTLCEGFPSCFWLRDKIVCLKNGFYLASQDHEQDDDAKKNDDGAIFVANGELAEVIKIDESKTVYAKLTSPNRVVKIPLAKNKDKEDANQERGDSESKGSVTNWDLAYALSVHKSQGSDFGVVLVVLDTYAGAKMVCDRSWIYTAISRAKQSCHLVGVSGTAERFVKRAKIDKRKTFLREMIAVEQFSREAGGL